MLPQTNVSFLSSLLTDARAKSASLFRFLYLDKDDVLESDDDDDDVGNNNHYVDLWEMEDVAPLVADLPTVQQPLPRPPPPAPRRKPKKKRTKYPRRIQRDSIWWTRFLAPAQRAELLQIPNGRLAKQFRKLFHAPYAVFLDLMSIATERWWPDWTEENRCRAGKLVSSLDLKILGSLFVLAQGVTHYVCSTCSNVSEEVHRSFFHQWLRHMSSIKDEFIFMPYDDLTYHKVSDDYAARGLPGCVGSVDCVHIGWDRCPTQYKNMYTGKEGYPSVAYEVICTCRKFIQSVSCGHPGTRNDKHIVKTDVSVMQLMESNGWLNAKKAWHSLGANGKNSFFVRT